MFVAIKWPLPRLQFHQFLVPQATPCFSFVPVSLVTPDSDSLLIVLRKGKHNCTSSSIAQFISCDHLSHFLRAFTMSMITARVPESVLEAMCLPF